LKIFLIGMMGSGKSYWAEKLSHQLKCSHYDLDSMIEAMEEKTIAEIFEEKGETYFFRKKESSVLKWFAQKNSFVLATGGGTPCFNNNMQWMNENGITIWLNENLDVLTKRLLKEKIHRPLIKAIPDDEIKNFLESKLAERTPFYMQAKYHLQENISTGSFTEIFKK